MEITPEIVRELLEYHQDTGEFFWRRRDRRWFKSNNSHSSWNSKFAGKRAGHVWENKRTGYQNREIVILGSSYLEHRIAWMWMTDDPLPEEIDHRNRIGTDNRWCNLRPSDCAKNTRNRSKRRDNTSGVTGVSWRSDARKWRAECMVKGKSYRLGLFDDLSDAARAVSEFRLKHGFDPSHGADLAHYV